MTDPTTVASSLTSIKTAIDLAKFLYDSGSSLKSAEQKFKVAELISSLADLKLQMVDMQTLLSEKEKVINSLRNEKLLESQIVYEEPSYFRLINGIKDGPFCQNCKDGSKKLIRLQGGARGEWNCKACNSWYFEKGHHESIKISSP